MLVMLHRAFSHSIARIIRAHLGAGKGGDKSVADIGVVFENCFLGACSQILLSTKALRSHRLGQGSVVSGLEPACPHLCLCLTLKFSRGIVQYVCCTVWYCRDMPVSNRLSKEGVSQRSPEVPVTA